MPNRRAFDETLSALAKRGERFGLILLDLDGCKNVNDRFGHAAGDALLVEMATRLKRPLLPDEFVVASEAMSSAF